MKDYTGKNADALNDKKLYLFDMDGTVYLGETLFDGVPELLRGITEKGGRYVFITNNSSRSVKDYVAKMRRLGIKEIDSEHFLTSGQVAFALLKEKFGNSLIYVQATKSLLDEYKKLGLNVTGEYTENASAVLVGYDPEITGEKIYATCRILTQFNVPYYATNPDWVCPVEFGYVPDCGSMCFGIEKATGRRPVFIGKPEPAIIFSAMNKFGFTPEETVAIGDRLYTDIASGNNAGVDTVCVLSGEVTFEEVKNATGNEIPTYVFRSVKDLI